MTRSLSFTQAGLRRAISAARRTGLRIKGIAPDGTLIVEDTVGNPEGSLPSAAAAGKNTVPADEWDDVEA